MCRPTATISALTDAQWSGFLPSRQESCICGRSVAVMPWGLPGLCSNSEKQYRVSVPFGNADSILTIVNVKVFSLVRGRRPAPVIPSGARLQPGDTDSSMEVPEGHFH